MISCFYIETVDTVIRMIRSLLSVLASLELYPLPFQYRPLPVNPQVLAATSDAIVIADLSFISLQAPPFQGGAFLYVKLGICPAIPHTLHSAC